MGGDEDEFDPLFEHYDPAFDNLPPNKTHQVLTPRSIRSFAVHL